MEVIIPIAIVCFLGTFIVSGMLNYKGEKRNSASANSSESKSTPKTPIVLCFFMFCAIFLIMFLMACAAEETYENRSEPTWLEARTLYDYAHGYGSYKEASKTHVVKWAKKYSWRKPYKARYYKYQANVLYHTKYNGNMTLKNFKKWYKIAYEKGERKENAINIDAFKKKYKIK